MLLNLCHVIQEDLSDLHYAHGFTHFGKSEGIESTPGTQKPDCAIDSVTWIRPQSLLVLLLQLDSWRRVAENESLKDATAKCFVKICPKC